MKNLDIDCFENKGFIVVKDIFSEDEIKSMRRSYKEMKNFCVENNLYNTLEGSPDLFLLKGDLCSFPYLKKFNYLVFNEKIVNVVKKLIGEEVIYFGESNCQSGPTPGGFHKDNRLNDRENRNGLDFIGDYPLVRVAIYLQDSDIYSGGLKIMPGSHKIPTSKFLTGGLNLSAKAGDLVIWKLTTSHSGHAKKLKFFKNISFHPRFEKLIPSKFENKKNIERRAMFIVYGAPGAHLERYIEYFKNRDDYKDYLKYAGFSKETEDLAIKAGVKHVKPIKDYGIDQNLFSASDTE